MAEDPTARLRQRIKAAINDDAAAKELIALLERAGTPEVVLRVPFPTLNNALPTGSSGRLDNEPNLLDGQTPDHVVVPADGDYVLEVEVVHTTLVT